MAYGKTASQLGTYADYIASRAVDGNTDGNVGHKSCAHPASTPGYAPWWSVDLGDTYEVTDMVLFPRGHEYGLYLLRLFNSCRKSKARQLTYEMFIHFTTRALSTR